MATVQRGRLVRMSLARGSKTEATLRDPYATNVAEEPVAFNGVDGELDAVEEDRRRAKHATTQVSQKTISMVDDLDVMLRQARKLGVPKLSLDGKVLRLLYERGIDVFVFGALPY